MKSICTLISALAISLMASAQATYFGPFNLHLCSSSNIVGHITYLNNTSLGANATSKLIFQHRYGDLAGMHNAYLSTPTGLYYTGSEWAIFDETFAALSPDLAFNVLNVKQNGTVFAHTVTGANLENNVSYIDNALLNNNPNAIFAISKTWENSVYQNNHTGVWYNTALGRWSVYNEQGPISNLLLNATYNIFVPNSYTTRFKHTSTEGSYITTLNHPLLNGNPNANIFVVHTFEIASMHYLDAEIGVWYDGNHWTIYSEDFTPIEAGSTFNVIIANSSPVVSVPENEKYGNANFECGPNPATDQVTIRWAENMHPTQIAIISADGKLARKFETDPRSTEITIDVNSLAAGIYLLKSKTDNALITGKLVVADK